MIRKHISSVFTLILVLVAFAHQNARAQGMAFFEGTWDQLKAEAQKQHKPIFVDCYTSWCGPCKMMANKTFPQKSVGDFYNANFVCYSMDMEKGEGPKIAQSFNVRFYPTLLYLNPDGTMMHRLGGYLPAADFLEEGKAALDPENCLAGLIKRFYAGEKDTSFLMKLAIMERNVDDKILEDAIAAFWKQAQGIDRNSPYNWLRFKELDNNVNSIQFEYVQQNKKAFEQKYGQEVVDKALFEKAAYSIQRAAEIKDENLMRKAKMILDSSNVAEIQKFAAIGEMLYYKSTADYKTMNKLAEKYVDKYAKNNAEELNNIAFEVANGISDKNSLKSALAWEEQSIKLKKSYSSLDNYAHILYKMGKNKEAETAATEAIDQAQKENANASASKELLLKIKNGN